MRLSDAPAWVLTRAVRPALQRIPLAWPATRWLLDAIYRVAFLPFGRDRPRGVPREAADLVARTDELNRRAEEYFVGSQALESILRKPFADEMSFPRHLVALGVLLQGLRIARSDVVVEFGAGGCWVSHFLNKFGCRTIAIDVSRTALELGRQLFRRDPFTNWEIGPAFVPYDGHRVPLASASCTKVIMVDAFHHVPNQREILGELHRILTSDGIVAMFEPGVGHGSASTSRHETAEYGVLENELVIEDVAALGLACGFHAAHVLVVGAEGPWEVPAADLGPFIRGKGFRPFWLHQTEALLASHFLLLYKGDPEPTTRQPKTLRARIDLRLGGAVLRGEVGRPTPLQLVLTNTAASRWLAGDGSGWTRLGAHLFRADSAQTLLDFDWLRASLPRDVCRDEQVVVDVVLPAIDEPGTYCVTFDLVIEGVTWFADRGSDALTCTLEVR